MTTTGDKAFVDTNVLLRALHIDVPMHTECDALVTQVRQNSFELWISYQVIREYLVQVSRPGILIPPLTSGEMTTQVKAIKAVFKVADETELVSEKLLKLIQEFPTAGKQIHDANIVATMLIYGIDTLLTLNVQDMKRFANNITILSPTVQL